MCFIVIQQYITLHKSNLNSQWSESGNEDLNWKFMLGGNVKNTFAISTVKLGYNEQHGTGKICSI